MVEPIVENQKQTFAAYITQKRKEAGLTQEELANKLFVTHSTVSKWERGLSYPDIALVSDVCRELSISEHEFFTACDDVAMGREKQEASAYRKLLLRWKNTFLGCYLVTIVVCFICDLATRHGLDWFWIVLTSLMLAFSFTNLPLMTKSEKGTLCSGGGHRFPVFASAFVLVLHARPADRFRLRRHGGLPCASVGTVSAGALLPEAPWLSRHCHGVSHGMEFSAGTVLYGGDRTKRAVRSFNHSHFLCARVVHLCGCGLCAASRLPESRANLPDLRFYGSHIWKLHFLRCFFRRLR